MELSVRLTYRRWRLLFSLLQQSPNTLCKQKKLLNVEVLLLLASVVFALVKRANYKVRVANGVIRF